LLHNTGSSRPLGTKEDLEKIEFGNSFTFKDVVSTCVSIIFIILIIRNFPDIFIDPENINEADSLKAPVHIQPE
jgi:quinol-cytochrome oxidoreductase complex cytochrome b subunit